MPFLVEDYTVGCCVKRGKPVEPRQRHPIVLVVRAEEIERWMGCRKGARLTAHLRRLRAAGLLIAAPGRLQSKVRGVGRAYVFATGADQQVPRLRRSRVIRA